MVLNGRTRKVGTNAASAPAARSPSFSVGGVTGSRLPGLGCLPVTVARGPDIHPLNVTPGGEFLLAAPGLATPRATPPGPGHSRFRGEVTGLAVAKDAAPATP